MKRKRLTANPNSGKYGLYPLPHEIFMPVPTTPEPIHALPTPHIPNPAPKSPTVPLVGMRPGSVNSLMHNFMPGNINIMPYSMTHFRSGHDPVPGRVTPSTPGSLIAHLKARV